MSHELVAYRAATFYNPLWPSPNTSEGRYNAPGDGPTQYLSLHPMTPWAEQLRNLDARTAEQARAVRVPVWAMRIRLADDPLVLAYGSVGDYGLHPCDLVADDHSACRALANSLRAREVPAFTAPSAALPGTRNLVVLQPRSVIDFHLEPMDDVDVPCSMLAQDGRCPEGFWQSVHYVGTGVPHAELEAFLHGDDFEFVQPEVTPASLASA